MKYFTLTQSHKILFTFLFAISFLKLSAQETGISPYSRIGLGDINNGHSPAYNTMGGASVALSDFNLLNISNPASYSSMLRHMPIFEIDGNSQFLTLNSNSGEGKLTATTFTKLALGIPVNNRMGISLGVLPYTTTGYDISSTNDEPNIGDVTYSFNGKGGLNRTYLGAGYKIINKDSVSLSLGFNFSFLFGNIEKTRRVEFPDDDKALNTLLSQSTNNYGFDFEFGMQYNQMITNKFSYSLGATFSTGSKLISTRDEFFGTYTNFSSVQITRDTLLFTSDNKGEINIPLNIKVGAAVKLNNSLEIAAQYQMQDWTSYKEDFEKSSASDSLLASSSISLGLRYNPSNVFNTSAKYYEKIQYRLGFRYEKSPLQFNNTQINEFGTSFGLGLPIKPSSTSKNEFKSLSMINVGVDFGSRGTTENGLIKENFTTVYFGISIMPQVRNRWFVKRKFD